MWLVCTHISHELLTGMRAQATVMGHLCPAVLLAFTDTTRPRKSHEKEGVEYHFISKQAFEADLHHNK